jgi:gas vesicle protein
MAQDQDEGAGLFYFLFGTLLGAGIALLVTPKTGRETRQFLKERGTEFGRLAKEELGVGSQSTQELVRQGREFVEGLSHKLAVAFEAGRQAMKEELAQSRGSDKGSGDA